MKRTLTIATFVCSLILAGAGPAAAHENHWPNWNSPPPIDRYHWVSSASMWVEDACFTSQEQFRIVLYQHVDYTGNAVKICTNRTREEHSPKAHFCDVPMAPPWVINGQHFSLCHAFNGSNGYVAQDAASSVRVWSVPSGKCVRLFYDVNHQYWYLELKQGVHVPRLWEWGFNDVVSSVKRVGGGKCSGTSPVKIYW